VNVDGPASPAEIAATVVVKLIELADRRLTMMAGLTAVVTAAVDELDPHRERDTSPTWWQDLPPWHSLDSLDRLRRAHDQLLVLEVQSAEVVHDLRGLLNLAAVGSPARPHGWTPGRAHTEMMRLALRRGEMVRDASLAERVLRPKLTKPISAGLRNGLRALIAEESVAQEERVRLSELLTAPTDLRQTG
jgi:hypothetical protein